MMCEVFTQSLIFFRTIMKSLTANQQDLLFIHLFFPEKWPSTGRLDGHLAKSLVVTTGIV